MVKFIKRFALLTGILMVSVVGVAGFYKAALPNIYFISEGEELMINSMFNVTAKPCESKVTVAVTQTTARSSRTTENQLMLFGSIPIKEVTAKSVERPKLVPCGQAFGIKLITDGVMVVDFTSLDSCCPAKECGIKEGDVIVSINGEEVGSNSDVSRIIRNCEGKDCEILLKRNGTEKSVNLTPVLSGGVYKAGMWVRDSSAGIGTLTFYDEETGIFGGLGHPVCDSDTKEMLPLSEGVVGDIKITGFIKSENGKPGQLLGEFASSDDLGDILLNCKDGLYGKLDKNPSQEKAVELGFRQEIKKGKAEIYCSTDGGEPKAYEVEISQINLHESAEHDLVIEITDKELLESTGGIVQGMSGSPIIQNGRLVGAVTHVFIDDPSKGYGIFADEMYQRCGECDCESHENSQNDSKAS